MLAFWGFGFGIKSDVNVLNTQAALDGKQREVPRENLRQACIVCQEYHQLNLCPEFKSKSLESQHNYVKEKGLCFGCLKSGHRARDCGLRLVCDICRKKHPSSLHDNYYGMEKYGGSQTLSQGHEAASAVSLSITGDKCSTILSMIVPVWVSSKANPTVERLVYALFDTQ